MKPIKKNRSSQNDILVFQFRFPNQIEYVCFDIGTNATFLIDRWLVEKTIGLL